MAGIRQIFELHDEYNSDISLSTTWLKEHVLSTSLKIYKIK